MADNKLLLCCGSDRRTGWTYLDADADSGAEFIAVIPPLPAKVKAIRWDIIELVHGIGSFYPWDAAALLRELHDVLRIGGRLILEQPDLRYCGYRPEWIFGDPSQRNERWMNHWAYTPETLSDSLMAAGFDRSRVVLLPAQYHLPQRDFRIEAVR